MAKLWEQRENNPLAWKASGPCVWLVGHSAMTASLSLCSSQWEESTARCAAAQESQAVLALELESLHTELESVSRSKNLVRAWRVAAGQEVGVGRLHSGPVPWEPSCTPKGVAAVVQVQAGGRRAEFVWPEAPHCDPFANVPGGGCRWLGARGGSPGPLPLEG